MHKKITLFAAIVLTVGLWAKPFTAKDADTDELLFTLDSGAGNQSLFFPAQKEWQNFNGRYFFGQNLYNNPHYYLIIEHYKGLNKKAAEFYEIIKKTLVQDNIITARLPVGKQVALENWYLRLDKEHGLREMGKQKIPAVKTTYKGQGKQACLVTDYYIQAGKNNFIVRLFWSITGELPDQVTGKDPAMEKMLAVKKIYDTLQFKVD